MATLRTVLVLLVSSVLSGPVAATELVMVQQAGCTWCERWNAEIGPAYPNTEEGRFAPLRRVDLHALPADLGVKRRISYTPTFLIIEQGREIARLEGYPGPDFFWPLLDGLLTEHTNYDPVDAGVDG